MLGYIIIGGVFWLVAAYSIADEVVVRRQDGRLGQSGREKYAARAAILLSPILVVSLVLYLILGYCAEGIKKMTTTLFQAIR